MRYITEQELRDSFAGGVPSRFVLPADCRLTPLAEQYLKDLRLLGGESLPDRGRKPEYMTHLNSREMVHKNHPRISLRGKLDLDQLPELSGFDRRQVCVPAHCPSNCPGARSCRYHRYLWEVSRCESMIQICNHNYLLADAVHRLEGRRPLLNDSRLLIVDEAHRLPETARQMCACSVSTTDLTELCSLL